LSAAVATAINGGFSFYIFFLFLTLDYLGLIWYYLIGFDCSEIGLCVCVLMIVNYEHEMNGNVVLDLVMCERK